MKINFFVILSVLAIVILCYGTVAKAQNSSIPNSWDWRNVMGQNWNTSVKNQGGNGTCWSFASTGMFESAINLYYGKNIGVDLSEQQLGDCDDSGSAQQITQLSGLNYNFPDANTTIFDEKCDPYVGRQIGYNACNSTNICSDWANRLWKPSDYLGFEGYTDNPGYYPPFPSTKIININSVDDFKKAVIKYGPLNTGLNSWIHGMVLAGYGGQSDWTTLSSCPFNSNGVTCYDDVGCVQPSCSTENAIKKSCYGSIKGNNFVSMSREYICANGNWRILNDNVCPDNELCYQGSCVPSSSVPAGYKSCWHDTSGQAGVVNYEKYTPGQGDTSWLFKNSYGTSLGDGGYEYIFTPISYLYSASVVLGPFTPPTDKTYWPAGFTNSPSPWFYKQTCTNPTKSPNYTVTMGFANGQQTTQNLSCPAGQVCQAVDSYGFISCTSAPVISCNPGQKIGDVDGDGTTTQADANLALQMVSQSIPTPSNICCIDANGDGKVSSGDATKILRIAAGTDKSPGVCTKTTSINVPQSSFASIFNALNIVFQKIQSLLGR